MNNEQNKPKTDFFSTRERLLLVEQAVNEFFHAGEVFTAAQIADSLAYYYKKKTGIPFSGSKVSLYKYIYEDIRALRHSGYQIEDAGGKGFRVTARVEGLTTGDIITLVDSIYAAKGLSIDEKEELEDKVTSIGIHQDSSKSKRTILDEAIGIGDEAYTVRFTYTPMVLKHMPKHKRGLSFAPYIIEAVPIKIVYWDPRKSYALVAFVKDKVQDIGDGELVRKNYEDEPGPSRFETECFDVYEMHLMSDIEILRNKRKTPIAKYWEQIEREERMLYRDEKTHDVVYDMPSAFLDDFIDIFGAPESENNSFGRRYEITDIPEKLDMSRLYLTVPERTLDKFFQWDLQKKHCVIFSPKNILEREEEYLKNICAAFNKKAYPVEPFTP